MKGQWQNQIYLATIDKLDDYYSANAEFVINVAEIDSSGAFLLEGDNLPEQAQFYRIYLLKEEHSEFNACLFVGGEDHNFIHVVLNNNSELEIMADFKTFAPFGDYQVQGSKENHFIKEVTAMVYPSYLFYEIRFPSELKFSQDKLMKDLFAFADTCSSPLISLAAINNTDYDAYFAYNTNTYETFAERLKSEMPKHPYTKDYIRKMRYYADDYTESSTDLFKILSAILGLLVCLLLWRNNKLLKAAKPAIVEVNQEEKPRKTSVHFTPQELKILGFIKEGKSNKEIASELFIEVSTVKSHINKLYGKMKVKNRREAIESVKSQQLLGL